MSDNTEQRSRQLSETFRDRTISEVKKLQRRKKAAWDPLSAEYINPEEDEKKLIKDIKFKLGVDDSYVDKMKKEFKIITNNADMLPFAAVKNILKQKGLQLCDVLEEESKLESIFDRFDLDMYGMMGFLQFTIINWFAEDHPIRKKMAALYRLSDLDNNGYIDKEELELCMLEFGLIPSEDACKLYDEGKEALYQQKEWIDAMMSSNETRAFFDKDIRDDLIKNTPAIPSSGAIVHVIFKKITIEGLNPTDTIQSVMEKISEKLNGLIDHTRFNRECLSIKEKKGFEKLNPNGTIEEEKLEIGKMELEAIVKTRILKK